MELAKTEKSSFLESIRTVSAGTPWLAKWAWDMDENVIGLHQMRIQVSRYVGVYVYIYVYTDIPTYYMLICQNVLEKAPKIESIFKLIFGSKLQKYILFLKVDFMENRLYFWSCFHV